MQIYAVELVSNLTSKGQAVYRDNKLVRSCYTKFDALTLLTMCDGLAVQMTYTRRYVLCDGWPKNYQILGLNSYHDHERLTGMSQSEKEGLAGFEAKHGLWGFFSCDECGMAWKTAMTYKGIVENESCPSCGFDCLPEGLSESPTVAIERGKDTLHRSTYLLRQSNRAKAKASAIARKSKE